MHSICNFNPPPSSIDAILHELLVIHHDPNEKWWDKIIIFASVSHVSAALRHCYYYRIFEERQEGGGAAREKLLWTAIFSSCLRLKTNDNQPIHGLIYHLHGKWMEKGNSRDKTWTSYAEYAKMLFWELCCMKMIFERKNKRIDNLGKLICENFNWYPKKKPL